MHVAACEVGADFEDLSRQRIDYSEGPNGETIATLTITLQDGSVHRYTASTDQAEVDSLAAVLASNEVRLARIEGLGDDEIGGMFDWAVDGIKAVANVAKKVVTSKVFKSAAKGLAVIAPVLGPLAPAALAVSGGMQAASSLTSAAIAASGGAKRSAKAITKSAARTVSRKVRSPRARKAMLTIANRKRKGAERIASRKPSRWISQPGGIRMRKGFAVRTKARKKPPSVFAAAKTGRLRSLKMGKVTGKRLRKAMKAGRVFWIAS